MEGLRGVGRELGRENLLRESCYLLSFSIFPLRGTWKDLERERKRKRERPGRRLRKSGGEKERRKQEIKSGRKRNRGRTSSHYEGKTFNEKFPLSLAISATVGDAGVLIENVVMVVSRRKVKGEREVPRC